MTWRRNTPAQMVIRTAIRMAALLAATGATLASFTTHALDPRLPLTRYVHEEWQIRDGLPQSSIYAITQTRDGYLWLATEEGIARFDGARFTVFNMGNQDTFRSNLFLSFYEDMDRSLWISSLNGLVRYKNGLFKRYDLEDGLPHKIIWTLTPDREGMLWIGTEGGLVRYADGKFEVYTVDDGLPHNAVHALLADQDGALWSGTDGGLARYMDGKFTTYTRKDGLPGDQVWSLAPDGQGGIWIGTPGDGLAHLKQGRWRNYTTRDGLPDNKIRSLYMDASGTSWIGTQGGVILRRDDAFVSLNIGKFPGLSFCEDHEGSLWIGTETYGLRRLRQGKFTVYTSEDGLGQNVALSVYEDQKGDVWIGTRGGGATRIQNGRPTTYTTVDGLESNNVFTIGEGLSGDIWLGTDGHGLSLWRNGRFTHHTTASGLNHNMVRAITPGQNGSLWIGTQDGLNRWKDGFFTSYDRIGDLKSTAVRALLEDRSGALWIGTEGGGLARLYQERFTDFYTSADGLGSDIITALHEDEEALWIGTDSGLSRLKNGKLITCTMKSGLFSSAMWQILEDSNGYLWMSTNTGIFRISKKEFDEFAEGRRSSITSISYGVADGMKNRECNGGSQPAGWKTRDGRLWFPTVEGVVVVDPDHLPINSIIPPVHIEAVTRDTIALTLADSLVLPPGTERLAFHYTALSFLAPEKVLFKYRLEGFDHDWIDAGARREAYYTNLPPGAYRFRVIACNNDGLWNETGDAVDVILQPFFYQTTWFFALCALTVILTGFGGHRLRIGQIKQRARELEGLVAVRTNELVEEKEKTEHALLEIEKAKDIIEADNDRRIHEMDEARTLQIAMLPQRLPSVPGLDLAVSMDTATEVGGDYYDAHLSEDATLTLILGDATGHGLRAGLVVASAKSAFQMLAGGHRPAAILDGMGQNLTAMNLGRLFMGALIARYTDGVLALSGAAMPPVFIFRAASGRVETLVLKGMPLGSPLAFRSEEIRIILEPGDVVLLMSDGFYEMRNADGQVIEEERIAAFLAEAAHRPAQAILDHLNGSGDAFRAGHAREDDSTLMVIKATI